MSGKIVIGTVLRVYQSRAYNRPWRAELWIASERLYCSRNCPDRAGAIASAERFASMWGYAVCVRVDGRARQRARQRIR